LGGIMAVLEVSLISFLVTSLRKSCADQWFTADKCDLREDWAAVGHNEELNAIHAMPRRLEYHLLAKSFTNPADA
jgi:hypothetical protein